ncbi:hypothetical protein AXK11_06485 [Cephaloticoccus primus]|uniref:Recombinase RmuC n=1 Tax=Cephaloticoccus primus TaxID=1548207 RepID=A0A139SLI9_9BACT|nr:DNA recombination protein RmuC [Cephaloticoccus primus]KXU35423.1 hypothetical protein AXK11_06485 [Cephaloticoccus primus]
MKLLLIALAVATLAAARAWALARQRNNILADQLAQRNSDNQRLSSALSAAEQARNSLSEQLTAAQIALAAQQATAEAERRAAEEKLADREATAKQYLEDIAALRATMKTEFEAAAAKIFNEKAKTFSTQNQSQLASLLDPLRERLKEFRERVDHIYKTDSDERSALKTQLAELRALNSTIGTEAQALTSALKGQSQVRGAWGELVLERLLDSAGLIKGENYLVQESLLTADGRRLRPDVILRLPEGRHLVIDSKVSLVAYERAANASDEPSREAATREHARAVRQHIDELSAKAYEDTGKLFTPDYVLMFIPLEPAFALALQADSGLYDYAFNKRVVLLTASSLLVTLKTIAALWNQDRQNKNVLAITDRAGALHDKFAGLLKDLEEIGARLAAAQSSYDNAMNKLHSGRGSLYSQVATLQKLGAKTKAPLPAAPEKYSHAEPLPSLS